MKAARLQSYGDVDQFRVDEVPMPEPAAGEILVRVEASAVNPFDLILRQGLTAQFIPLPLPAVLAGTRVVVRDAAGVERLSSLFFVAPTQVNFLIPAGTAAGTATITITSDDGTVSAGTVQVATVAPSLFTANASGRDAAAGFALRVTASGAQINEPIQRFDPTQSKFVPVPIDVGVPGNQVFLVLFGTGIRFRSALSSVTATIGGMPVSVQYAGPQGNFVGLDQINILLPGSLAARGEADLVLTVDGKASNTVRINIK